MSLFRKLIAAFMLSLTIAMSVAAPLKDASAEVTSQALALIGTHYKYGGSTPKTGLDCSGLTKYIYSTIGVDLPRMSVDQAKIGEFVPIDDLQPGDLVFFNTRHRFSHVGVYIGDNRFVHAPKHGHRVEISELEDYWLRYFGTARRVKLPS